MTLENQILRDLASGRATADSIARRLKRETEVIEATLKHLLTGNKVTTSTLGPLLIYQLPP